MAASQASKVSMVSVGRRRLASLLQTKPIVSITPMRQTTRGVGQGLAVALTVCVAAAHDRLRQVLEQASTGAA